MFRKKLSKNIYHVDVKMIWYGIYLVLYGTISINLSSYHWLYNHLETEAVVDEKFFCRTIYKLSYLHNVTIGSDYTLLIISPQNVHIVLFCSVNTKKWKNNKKCIIVKLISNK